ncbi:Tetratricopeptide repeat-containing protein [Halopseudomonas pachastrellae]|nr:Tetratricopeptide repeat-containing protein [Halopseudomonas pachastrellae]
MHETSYSMKVFSASTLPALLAAGLLLSGCSSLSQPDAPAAPAQPPSTSETETAADTPVTYGNFQQDTLYELLSAEIAGQRNRFDLALDNYLRQARRTRDAGISERALRVAEFLGNEPAALEMARLWVEVAPQDPEALRSAAIHLARTGRHEQAMDMMQRALEQHGETHFDFLALAAADTDATTRNALLDSLERMTERFPDNTQLVFARALLLQQANRNDEALALLEDHPHTDEAPPAILLHSRLVAEHDTEEATEILYRGLQRFPDDTRLRLMLARTLVSEGNFADARTQYAKLARDNPDEADLQLSLGLIELELGEASDAVIHLQNTLQLAPGNNTARYHLGNAYLAADRPDDALLTWQSIDSGTELLTSRVQMARLLLEQNRIAALQAQLQQDRDQHPQHGLALFQIEIEALLPNHPELAIQQANTALQAYPNDSNLLYSRAMLHEMLGNPRGLEEDLGAIIAREPDNAMALNALGYTLADRNQRLEEALALIKRAAALDPSDPAIQDSLGWVYYRLGDLDRAEALLRDAYAAYPDQEVAAHLGEVLWRQGKEREARRVWREALEHSPDSQLIPATRDRLEAE